MNSSIEDDDDDEDLEEAPSGSLEGEDDDDDDDDDEEEEDPATEPTSTTVPNATSTPPYLLHATPTLPSLSNPTLTPSLREISNEAIWSLSTAKPGNGVDQIRDSSVDTYWQSDGAQPHLINIQFVKRASVCEVAFYLDYNLDESYTPRKMCVKVGMTCHDLEEVRCVELNEPVGWVSVPLKSVLDPLDEEEEEEEANPASEEEKENAENCEELRAAIRRPVRAHFIQICVVAMHQNGRDTHIRQVKIFGPREEMVRMGISNAGAKGGYATKFTTVQMTQFDSCR